MLISNLTGHLWPIENIEGVLVDEYSYASLFRIEGR